MTKRYESAPSPGDSLLSFGGIPFLNGEGPAHSRLTTRQRHELALIATRLRLPARMRLYHEAAQASWVFITTDGAVKAYRDLPSGKRQVSAFLFPGDIFGLAERGHYVNTTQTITRVTLYRIPLDKLVEVLRHDADLGLQVLCKVTHALREAQRRAIVVSRRDAAGRLAMFLLTMRTHLSGNSAVHLDTIPLPMSRTDIAGYLALSLEAVSRASAELERRKLVAFESRHVVRVLDMKRLQALAADV
jgi:CRP-like cAMP-binding protein